MLSNWFRRLWPYFAAAEGCSLVSCAMLVYLYAGTEGQTDMVIDLLLSMIAVMPLTIFVFAWAFDVYLRCIIGQLLSMLRRERCCMDLRCFLRLPGEGMMKAASIAQVILASVTIGIMLFPVMVRWYG